MALPILSGFSLNTDELIDTRHHVKTVKELKEMKNPTEGLVTWVSELDSLAVYRNGAWNKIQTTLQQI